MVYIFLNHNSRIYFFIPMCIMGCTDTWRLTFHGNNLISWSSKWQSALSRSSAKVKYGVVKMSSLKHVDRQISNFNNISLSQKSLLSTMTTWVTIIFLAIKYNINTSNTKDIHLSLKSHLSCSLHLTCYVTLQNCLYHFVAYEKISFSTSTHHVMNLETMATYEKISFSTT